MAKWADYCISAVRYDGERKHIERVRVHHDNGDTIGQPNDLTRDSVISSIEGGNTFVTILKSSDGKWKKGEDVHIVKVNNKKYIRTDANQKESDNLENLPEY